MKEHKDKGNRECWAWGGPIFDRMTREEVFDMVICEQIREK